MSGRMFKAGRIPRAGLLFSAALAICLLFASCQIRQPDSQQKMQTAIPSPAAAAETSPPVQEPSPYATEATLIAVGDIMMHKRQIAAGFDVSAKTYDFSPFFALVKDELAKGDWVTGNLETPLADDDPRGYTGYPEFNAPPELADALKDAGFNVITTANNHSLDRRERGIVRTLANLHARGFLTKGVAATPEEAEQSAVMTKNGISMAFLAYTYGTNGIPIPEGKDYLVPLIDEEAMKTAIARERQAGADIVTVAVHFGNEYQLEPNESQKKLARELFAAGADIILGSHPHVVQPYELLKSQDALGRERTGVVIYSLGNFISDQDRYHEPFKPTDTGVLFEVRVRKTMPENTTEIVGIDFKPTYVQRYKDNGKLQFRVLPIEAALTRKDDPYLREKDMATLEKFLQEMNSHVRSIEAAAEVNSQ